MFFFFFFVDNQTKIIVGTAVAVGTITAAGLAYLYSKSVNEPIPNKCDFLPKKFTPKFILCLNTCSIFNCNC